MADRIFDVMEAPGPSELNGMTMLASGAAIQQVRSPFTTAVSVQRPRSLKEVSHRLVEEANLAGEDFFYGWGQGKDAIEGPSVKLALAAARCYGNCAVVSQPMQDLPDSWVFTSSFIDLETGFTLDRQFRQAKKWTVYGKFDEARKEDIRFQIGQSKAARNVILNSIPAGLVDKAMSAAKAGVRARIDKFVQEKGLPAAVDMVLRSLAKVGVKPEAVLAKLELADINAIGVEHIVILNGDCAAIVNGQERAADLFPAAGAKTEDLAKKLAAQAESQKKATPAPTTPAIEQPTATNGAHAAEPADPKPGRSKKTDQPGTAKPINKAQLARLNEMATTVPATAWSEALKSTGKNLLTNLTAVEADVMISRLFSTPLNPNPNDAASPEQLQSLTLLAGRITAEEFDFMLEPYNVAKVEELTRAQADQLIERLVAIPEGE